MTESEGCLGPGVPYDAPPLLLIQTDYIYPAVLYKWGLLIVIKIPRFACQTGQNPNLPHALVDIVPEMPEFGRLRGVRGRYSL
jgi:hypothetical protein